MLKKQDRDYYWGVKVARVAETSEVNNGHHALLLESSASSKCYSACKLIIDKPMCVVKFNEMLSCLIALEAKQAPSTPQKQGLCSAP